MLRVDNGSTYYKYIVLLVRQTSGTKGFRVHIEIREIWRDTLFFIFISIRRYYTPTWMLNRRLWDGKKRKKTIITTNNNRSSGSTYFITIIVISGWRSARPLPRPSRNVFVSAILKFPIRSTHDYAPAWQNIYWAFVPAGVVDYRSFFVVVHKKKECPLCRIVKWQNWIIRTCITYLLYNTTELKPTRWFFLLTTCYYTIV